MANLFLTHRCTRGCSFCFARNVINKNDDKTNEILTIDEVRTVLSHFRGQFPEIGLLGGEPFLYPYLYEVMDLLWQQNIIPKIFTSATNPVPEKIQEIDIRQHPVNFVVNVGTRDSYSEKKYANLTRFFARFHAVSALSYTIFDLEDDPSFLFDIIDEFRLLRRFIRVGVALPIYMGGNRYIDKKEYREVGKFFVNFAEMAYKRHIKLGMDCGFVACMFTPLEIGALQRCGVRFPFNCGSAIDIGPGLKAWNCFPLFQLQSENVLESKNIGELTSKFKKKLADYFNKTGIFPYCGDCKHYIRKVCDGGCKSFKSI